MKTYAAKIMTVSGKESALRVIDIKNCSNTVKQGCFRMSKCFKKINNCFINRGHILSWRDLKKMRAGIKKPALLLSYPDSNQDKQNQNLLCYHYTIRQSPYAPKGLQI